MERTEGELAARAIQSVLNSESAYCKFLSANDSGATGGHQSGILISTTAKDMLFKQELAGESIVKRTVRINWQSGFATESCFTWYSSKKELRITRFGRGFPFLVPEQTGTLFILTRQEEEAYSGFFLETEDGIEQFFNAFGLSPTETNRPIDRGRIRQEAKEGLAIQEFIAGLTVDFPASQEMSAAARRIRDAIDEGTKNNLAGSSKGAFRDPDRKIIEWTEMEYSLFRALERARYGEEVAAGFASVDDFVSMANMVLNRRKSRAGKSLEHHLSAIFDGNGISYTPQAVTEGNKRPDFIFPSQKAYRDPDFPEERLITLAAKTTCKDRWRQIINEADRLKGRPKYLCTLQQGISPAQMDEMQAENVILVVPRPYIASYPSDRRDRIWTVERFVRYVKDMQKSAEENR